LVRRLLENGANSSFVHQLADEQVPLQELVRSPLRVEARPTLPLPGDLYGPGRPNSRGLDVAVREHRAQLAAAYGAVRLPTVTELGAGATSALVTTLAGGFDRWSERP